VKLYLDLWICIRASPPLAQYVTLPNYFSHPSLVTKFLPTPPIKLKLGLQVGRQRETTDSKITDSNPLGPIKPSTQSETGSCQQVRFDCVCKTVVAGLWKVYNFSGFPVDSLDCTDEPHLRFPVNFHWRVIYYVLSIGGDALSAMISNSGAKSKEND